MRESIPADVKLAATISYMAIGITYKESQYDFQIDQSIYSLFIHKFQDAVFGTKILKIYMKKYKLKFKFLV